MSMILQDFSAPALVRAIEENAIASCKTWARWPGLELHEDSDILWTLTNIPFPIFNAVLRAQISPENIEERIEAVLTSARQRKVPMIWFTTPFTQPVDLGTHLESKGFTLVGTSAGMAVDLLDLDKSVPTPTGLSVEEVCDRETLRIWCNIMIPVYEFPIFTAKPWFEMHAAVGFGIRSPWRHYVARLKGTPVATASLFLGSGGASVANVATIPESRNQGIGGAITLETLCEARRMGYRIGTLCSVEGAKGIYRKLGFREYCRMRMYLWTND